MESGGGGGGDFYLVAYHGGGEHQGVVLLLISLVLATAKTVDGEDFFKTGAVEHNVLGVIECMPIVWGVVMAGEEKEILPEAFFGERNVEILRQVTFVGKEGGKMLHLGGVVDSATHDDGVGEMANGVAAIM